MMSVTIDSSLAGIDWEQSEGGSDRRQLRQRSHGSRTLCRSFSQSQHVAFARDGDRLVGMARLLTDGVCNAYLLDVWTASAYRRRGIGSAMIVHLIEQVPGQHVGLQTDDAQLFYGSLGFKSQPEYLSRVVGSWLDNDANR